MNIYFHIKKEKSDLYHIPAARYFYKNPLPQPPTLTPSPHRSQALICTGLTNRYRPAGTKQPPI